MPDTLTPAPSGAVAAPADVLTPVEAAAIATPVPVAADDASADIAAASRALREKALAQPRNPDGTFTTPEGTAPVVEAAPADAEAVPQADGAPADAPAPETTPEAEPKVFVLKGEAQRGEQDIELDITGLPPEVVERLERSEKQGMRRKEFDGAMQKVNKLQADLDAVETEIAVDSTGFVLNHVPSAKRGDLAQALIVEHLDELRPVISAIWDDEAARLRLLSDIRNGVQSRRTEVTTTVQGARAAAALRGAIGALVPDSADDGLAGEFFQTSVALVQAKLAQNQILTPEQLPEFLAAHRRRFFGADGEAAPTPPVRPKLAVKPKPPTAAAGTSPTTVLSQDAVKAQMAARTAALATAKQGAGAAAVQRPGPGPNATIEEASAFLRAQKR